eukprot:TRINITY_DN55020_c0_g1_i1.p2 TRINITY_DN55020_c0_g1~~TRINITY_DN55020_c0_g1_i1.p2  ORF type:complete len:302 (+),score=42.06 TRINITY_DN55020_c0_g1_i1:60-908(+)
MPPRKPRQTAIEARAAAQCRVCQGPYDSGDCAPVFLPCGHSICAHCSGITQCPASGCGQPLAVPDGGYPVNKDLLLAFGLLGAAAAAAAPAAAPAAAAALAAVTAAALAAAAAGQRAPPRDIRRVQLKVPADSRGRYCGPGRSLLNELVEQFEVEIDVPYGQQGQYITISGPPDGVAQTLNTYSARNLPVYGVMVSDTACPGPLSIRAVQFNIPAAVTGRLIGPGGANVRALRADNQVDIFIPGRGEEGSCQISGQAAGVTAALGRIRARQINVQIISDTQT